MPHRAAHLRGALLALTAFGLYATHDAVVKFLGGAYTTFQIIFFATLLTFPFVFGLLLLDRTEGTLIARHPYWQLVRGLLSIVTANLAFYAFTHLPLAQAYAILFATPLLVALMAVPFLGEALSLRRGLAVLTGLVGVLIVLRPGFAPLSLGHFAGIGAAFSGAMTSVVMRKVGPAERTAVLMLYPMLALVIVMACILPWVYRPMPLAHLGLLTVMAGFAFFGAVSFIAAYKRAPAAIVAPMQYSQILWASFYGWLFFGETPDAYTALGVAVIIGSGLYIVLRKDRRPAPMPEKTAPAA